MSSIRLCVGLFLEFYNNCTFLVVVTACGGTFTDRTGDVMSPNYPNYYPDYMSCYYYINAPDYHTIRLTFHYFETYHYSDKLRVSSLDMALVILQTT